MKRLVVAAVLCLVVVPALAAGDYDRKTKTDAYEIRLRVPAVAMAVAPLKAEIFRRWKKDSDELTSQAVSDKKDMPEFFHGYALDRQWRVTFESADVLSVSGYSFIDEGGAHPNAAFDSIVWDKTASRAVPLDDLFVKGQAPAAIAAIAASARRTFLAWSNKQGDGPTDPGTADEGIGKDSAHLGHYALTHEKGVTKANGIVLLYGAGEAWPHVIGDVKLAVPVSVFRKYLTPRWAAEFK
ncbi:MAG: hypothetical protein ISS15_18765 [Alphaproteobacteria bacterium]|nr:hypothetical protein [Alphaproteobacteria bacterium]MBL7099705.1 hypothetical protein [Alphaproteobacteria bacterium]